MKKIKIIGLFSIFLLAVISHFMYQLSPNKIFSILFPVNESIWEHMKLIVTPTILFSIFEYLIYRKKGINYHNLLLSYVIATIVGIISYLIIYIPLYDLFGHNAFIAISLLFIIFIIVEVISYYIINSRDIKYSNILGLGLLLIIYFIFGYFTYYPPSINLFYDSLNKGYGIIQK